MPGQRTLEGVFVPLITPFDDAGRVDVESVERLAAEALDAGAAGPGSFDCSGLTQYAYAAAGISLPHSSSMQSQMGSSVSPSAMAPGDLLFYYSPVSHVAMYIGNGKMVHASTYGQPVKVVPVSSMSGLVSVRRIA